MGEALLLLLSLRGRKKKKKTTKTAAASFLPSLFQDVHNYIHLNHIKEQLSRHLQHA